MILKTKKLRLLPFLCFILCFSCSFTFAKNTQVKTLELPKNIKLGTTLGNETVYFGGLSGLTFSHQKKNKLYFWTLTDRGPNAEPFAFEKNSEKSRPFLLPDYQLRLIQLVFDTKKNIMNIHKQLLLQDPQGQPLTGIPNLATSKDKKHQHEPPTDLVGKSLTLNAYGLDPEGIAIDQAGHFWLVDEYGPAIVEFNKKGKMLNKYVPQGTGYKSAHIHAVLPEVIKERKMNRGFEAVSIANDKLYAVLQSPLPTKKKSDVIRIIEFDLKKREVTGQYVYLLDDVKQADKIGGMTALNENEFLLIERDGKNDNDAIKKIYKISIAADKNLLANAYDAMIFNSTQLESLSKKDLLKKYALSKTLWMDLKDHKLNSLADKYEGITYVPAMDALYLINDNDFGITGIFDPKTGKSDKGTQLFKSYFIQIKN
ncbi:MAG TPA: esterase-like activity of phytase family protein [Oligoflexia bacterium]|nr:esterase-like activity of phytase family protein [Oligoflexia bacterium]HMR24390.1 esterase-like activity of phytase family protein [Oligoflexia bacterium]